MVDFLVELAKVTDKPVSREELYKEDEEGQGPRGLIVGCSDVSPARIVAMKRMRR